MGISVGLGLSALLPAGLGFRNVLINGGFDVWQRGTTGFGTTDGTYTADRWRHTSNGLTVTRDTDVPVGFRYSAKLVGTSDNSFTQRIESATSSKLAEKEVYFSCWAKRTSGAGALDVRFYYPSAEDNFATVTQIGSTIVLSSSPGSSWTYYTATITLPSNVSTGLMMLINNVGAATTFITGVQLEQNYQATPFEQRPIGVELALCQRYYQRRTGTGSTTYTSLGGFGAFGSSAQADFDFVLPVVMRVVPHTIDYHSASGFIGSTSNASYTSTSLGIQTVTATTQVFAITLSGMSGTAGLAVRLLVNNNTSGYLGWSAEL